MSDTVLVIDDVRLNLALMCALVDGIPGLRAVGIDDPIAALGWAERERPVLVLLDYAMPTMTGVAFLDRFRTSEHGATVPVIVVTASTDRATLLAVLAAGANDFVRKPIDEIELIARVRSNAAFGRASRQLFDLASVDSLTGLDTRRRLLMRLDDEVARAQRYGAPLSLVAFDIDHFKRINDTLGHDGGDAVLREVGRRTRETVRDIDFVGRIGGEEFAWVLPSTHLAAAHVAAERLRLALEAAPFTNDMRVTASFGATEFATGESGSNLLKRADGLLYRAKAAGRNHVLSMAA